MLSITLGSLIIYRYLDTAGTGAAVGGLFDAGGGGVDRRCRRGGGECVDDRLDADEEPERRFRWLSRLRTGFTSTGSCLIFWNEILVQSIENSKTSLDGLKRAFKLSLPILCKLNMV